MKYKWYKIAESVQELNNLTEIEVANKKICIVVHEDAVYACTAKCPHAGGKLAEGYIDALGNMVCPLHRYKFNLQNGRNTSGEGYFLKTYPIEVRNEGIFVGIAQNSLF